MGDLFAILSATFFAFTNVFIRKGTTAASKDNGVFLSIVLTAAISGLCVLVFGFINGFPRFTTEGILWFAGAGFMTAFLGRILQYTSIQHLGAIRASAMKRLIPFFTVILGALLLGEQITLPLAVGMLCIFTGIAMLIVQSLRASRKEAAATGKQETAAAIVSTDKPSLFGRIKSVLALIGTLGFFYGPASALAYSFGYIARKRGLYEIADPFFGAMAGGVTGVILFAAMALFQEKYRYSVTQSFRTFKPWLFFGGVANSLGQIAYFCALQISTISRVALITSLEVFITMFLSVWIFKTREHLTFTVVLACIISVIGAAVIIVG